jgi:hypothetical protein
MVLCYMPPHLRGLEAPRPRDSTTPKAAFLKRPVSRRSPHLGVYPVPGMDEGNPISYRLLERGTAVWSADGREIGTVVEVLATGREDIFDGIVIQTQKGRRFVDAPEVARIAERRVTLSISYSEAVQLPEPEGGPPEFRADPAAGRWSRFFGGGWRRR